MKECIVCKSTTGKFDPRSRKCKRCHNYLVRYGITSIDVDKMYQEQNSSCKLCKREIELYSRKKINSAYVDHRHETGKVRGLLCLPCNSMIGYFETMNIQIDQIAKYLKVS